MHTVTALPRRPPDAGLSTAPSVTIQSLAAESFIGSGVLHCADVNSDGLRDLLIGSHLAMTDVGTVSLPSLCWRAFVALLHDFVERSLMRVSRHSVAVLTYFTLPLATRVRVAPLSC